MNILLALEHLGYTNITDFEVWFVDGTVNDIREWKHSDPQPTQPELVAAWDAYQLANPVDIDYIKLVARAEVDAAAERARLRYVTSGKYPSSRSICLPLPPGNLSGRSPISQTSPWALSAGFTAKATCSPRRPSSIWQNSNRQVPGRRPGGSGTSGYQKSKETH